MTISPAKSGKRFGISSFTYSWSIGRCGRIPRRPLTPLGLLEKAAALGAKVLQIADNLPLHRLDKSALGVLRSAAENARIELEVGTCGLKSGTLDTYIAIAETLGARTIRILIDDAGYHPDPSRCVAVLRDFRMTLRRKGLILALENHDRFKAATYAFIVEKTGSDHVGICLDTINSIGTYESLENVVSILGPYTVNVHLKDFTIERFPHRLGFIVQGAPLGKGMLDTAWFFERMKRFKRVESVILELWTPPERSLRETIRKEEQWAEESVKFYRNKFGNYSVPIPDYS